MHYILTKRIKNQKKEMEEENTIKICRQTKIGKKETFMHTRFQIIDDPIMNFSSLLFLLVD